MNDNALEIQMGLSCCNRRNIPMSDSLWGFTDLTWNVQKDASLPGVVAAVRDSAV